MKAARLALRRREPVRLEAASTAGRVPPHDLDAEAAVLSAILLNREALDRVLEILKPEHFYSDANGKIFEAAMTLAVAGTPIDIVSVASWLRDREKLAQIGGASYLAQIADATPAVAHVSAHAAVVHEKWRLRHLIAVCQKISAEGYGDTGPVQEFIDSAEQAIYDLARTSSTEQASQPIGALAAELMQEIASAAERGERTTGIATGYERFDAKTAGLHDGDLTILAARPGMGKTALALNLAVNVAAPRRVHGVEDLLPGYGVVVFSLEMPRKQITARALCSEARVDLGKMRQGMLQPEDWRRLAEAGHFMGTLPIWIDDTPGITLLGIRAKVRRHQAEYNRESPDQHQARRVGLVVVDYLQLMGSDGDAANREQEISQISRGLKGLAKELRVPVIALSQLNRAVEARTDKRPQLSDLRESGAIEQDADNIVFVYRDEYYRPDATDARGLAELIIAKQRNGPTGTVLTKFTGSYTRFENLTSAQYAANDEA